MIKNKVDPKVSQNKDKIVPDFKPVADAGYYPEIPQTQSAFDKLIQTLTLFDPYTELKGLIENLYGKIYNSTGIQTPTTLSLEILTQWYCAMIRSQPRYKDSLKPGVTLGNIQIFGFQPAPAVSRLLTKKPEPVQIPTNAWSALLSQTPDPKKYGIALAVKFDITLLTKGLRAEQTRLLKLFPGSLVDTQVDKSQNLVKISLSHQSGRSMNIEFKQG